MEAMTPRDPSGPNLEQRPELQQSSDLQQRCESAPTWTPDREQLWKLLNELHPDAAEFYRQAVEALQLTPLVQVRLIVASHCVRELIPSLLEIRGVARPGRTDVNRATRNLFEAWQDSGLAFATDPAGPEPDDERYTVPGVVFPRAQAVAAKGAEANHNTRTMTALIATGVATTADDAPVRRLHTAIEHFRKWTHRHDYGEPPRPVPAAEFVEAEFRIIEESLLAQLAHRGDRIRELRRILAEANTTVEDGS